MIAETKEQWSKTLYLRYRSEQDTRILFHSVLDDTFPVLEQLTHAVCAQLPSPGLYRVVVERRENETHIAFDELGEADEACAMAFYAKDQSGHCEVGECHYDPPEVSSQLSLAQALAFGLAEQAKAQENGTTGYCFVTAIPR